jgi:hypothetical protein
LNKNILEVQGEEINTNTKPEENEEEININSKPEANDEHSNMKIKKLSQIV